MSVSVVGFLHAYGEDCKKKNIVFDNCSGANLRKEELQNFLEKKLEQLKNLE